VQVWERGRERQSYNVDIWQPVIHN